MAGTATKKFTDVIEGAFGSDEPLEQQEAFKEDEQVVTEETEMLPTIPEEGTASTSTSGVRPKRKAATAAAVKSSKKAKGKTGVCSLKDATAYYPTTADRPEYLHSGVSKRFFSKRKSSAITKEAGYSCNYSSAMKEDGVIVANCELMCTNKSQLSTHIRQMHLGLAITCFVCNRRWWAASTWKDHMKSAHSRLSDKDYYVKEGADIAGYHKSLDVKKEVTAEELI